MKSKSVLKKFSFSVETLHRTCQSDLGSYWIFDLTYCPDFRLGNILLLQVRQTQISKKGKQGVQGADLL